MPPKKRVDKLPPYVYKRRHGYVLRTYIDKNSPMRSVTLCPAEAPLSQVWQEYEKLKHGQQKTLRWLLYEYKHSKQYEKLSARTRRDRDEFIDRICAYRMKSGKPFGDAELKNITSGSLRKYLDAREKDGSPVSGNRELAIISVAWNWALERDYLSGVNPCKVVKPNEEKPREKYVSEEEYQAIYAIAPRYIQQGMELAYLCRLRRIEIINAKRSQILTVGFDTLRGKGSRHSITEWSDRLRAAMQSDHEIASMYILHDSRGQKITESAFKSAWRRLQAKMPKMGIERFNFHDIKAAGVSDVDGGDEEKMSASGHKDRKTMLKYDRKKRVVKPTK